MYYNLPRPRDRRLLPCAAYSLHFRHIVGQPPIEPRNALLGGFLRLSCAKRLLAAIAIGNKLKVCYWGLSPSLSLSREDST